MFPFLFSVKTAFVLLSVVLKVHVTVGLYAVYYFRLFSHMLFMRPVYMLETNFKYEIKQTLNT